MISNQEKKILVQNAIKVYKNAYAPYSRYKVGAAILTEDDNIYTGSNFESAAFGAGVCAERVALGTALSKGERKFKAICVCGNNVNITPCGVCRQALAEFNDIEVICCDEHGNTKEYFLSDLLPYSFDSKQVIYNIIKWHSEK